MRIFLSKLNIMCNVQADHLAGDYMNHHGKPRLISPLLPAAKCSILIGQTSHHGHYTTSVGCAASLPLLFQYFEKTHQWATAWDTFQLAANNYTSTDNHLLKLVYDKLPTQMHKSRSDGQLPSKCHNWDHPETFDHLMKCDTLWQMHSDKNYPMPSNNTALLIVLQKLLISPLSKPY
jgi:hypothetical protein